MSRIAVALALLATLATGCAGMGTKRTAGGQIQRTQQTETVDTGSVMDGRPELGQR